MYNFFIAYTAQNYVIDARITKEMHTNNNKIMDSSLTLIDAFFVWLFVLSIWIYLGKFQVKTTTYLTFSTHLNLRSIPAICAKCTYKLWRSRDWYIMMLIESQKLIWSQLVTSERLKFDLELPICSCGRGCCQHIVPRLPFTSKLITHK